MDVLHFLMRRQADAVLERPLLDELRDGLLGQSPHDLEAREHRARVDGDDDLFGKPEGVDLLALGVATRVAGAVLKHQVDGLFLAVEDQAAPPGHEQDRGLGVGGVGDQDVFPPAAARHDVPGVEHEGWEVREENLRPDVVLDLLGQRVVGELAEDLVGVRDGREHHPQVRPGRHAARSRIGRSSR